MNFMTNIDDSTFYILSGLILFLIFSSIISYSIYYTAQNESRKSKFEHILDRIKSWWIIVIVFIITALIGEIGSVILFAFISFFALREFATIIKTRMSDHRVLFWAFFLILPFQYYLVGIKWYGFFTVFIPVYVYIFIPIRIMITGDYKHFLTRASQIQWSLMVSVYFVSYIPAILNLEIINHEGSNFNLLLFLIIIVQLNDVFQFIWGKLLGKRRLAPTISPNKTVEGFLGGLITSTLIGSALGWATPFEYWQAALMAMVISLLGVAGDLTMSAIKRDNGIKDYGNMIKGHGGVMDRIDSLCFAAPIFFHLTRYFFA